MKFCDFKGNFKAISDLKAFHNSNQSTLLVIGNVGTGKSTLFEILKNEYEYDMLLVTEITIHPMLIRDFVKHTTIEGMFYKKRKLIFIDDINVVLQSDKNIFSQIKDYKQKCRFIFTVRTSDEKKTVSSLKQLCDMKIVLNPLNYKDCFQIVLNRIDESERDTVDEGKLIRMIKSLKCNIPKVIMLLDTVKQNYESIEVLPDVGDVFEHNVYQTMRLFFSSKLTHDEVIDICVRDTHLFSSLIHEHLSKIKASTKYIQNMVTMYDTLAFCDIFDKHIYTRCDKNVVRDMVNMYRFQKINTLLSPMFSPNNTFEFTQQFTKLSSQMNIKKKLLKIESDTNFKDNMFDILQYISSKSHPTHTQESDKWIGELVTKFKKEFKI
jgi:deoxyadenosine/deoxycytidine kinase